MMKALTKELGRAFFIGVLVYLVMSIVQYLNGYFYDTVQDAIIGFGYNQLYSVSLYLANAVLIYYLVKKYRQDLFKVRHLFKGIFGGMTITLVTIFILHFVEMVAIKGTSLTEFIGNVNLENYSMSLVISMVVCFVFYAAYYYRFTNEKKVKEQKLIAGTASAKFDALKNQLDPHFLFNSLNVLTSLIEENPEAAMKFTTALSKVYRYVLEQKNKDLVTVEEELIFAKLYMSLIKMRFEDSIVFTLPETISNPEAKVVPLSLQLLLENAVKHNQVTPTKKLHITIEEDNGSLRVTNNFQPKQVVKKGSGVGLQNITQRYNLITNRAVMIQQDEKLFSIAIPMLTKDTMTMNTQDTYISEKRFESAKEHVEKLKGFYIHFTIYLIFVPVFIYLNYNSNAGFPWAIFPIGGWGFGVLGHASETFSWNPFFGKNWEERKIRELMDDDRD
jgi:hypothetical protein